MSKKSREAIKDNLARAIAPPTPPRKRSAHLDGLLDEYAPPEAAVQTQTQPPPSPSQPASLSQSTSHVESASLAPVADLATRGASLADSTSLAPRERLADKTIDLWAGVTELHTGYLRLYGVIVEKIYRHLDPTEQAVYTQLYALSWGYGNPSCRVSLPRLAERAGMGQTATHKAVKRLASKGMVEKREVTLGKGKDQGVEYWLPLPTRLAEDIRLARNTRLVQSASIKRKDLKENNKKGINRLTPEEIKSFTATVVDLLVEGKSVEEVEQAYAPSMHPADWAAVKSVALAQGASKKEK
jgi:hypothetical protein